VTSATGVDALGEWVRTAYGLGDGPLARTPGGRGAEAVVWRLEVGHEAFALKQPFVAREEVGLAREAALLDHFAAAGVEVPTHRVACDGRYAAGLPAALGGGQVRLTHWVEGAAPGSGTRALARPLGTLLAHLHRCAPPTHEQPVAWYTTTPTEGDWAELARSAVDRPWGERLGARLGDLAAYARLVERAGPGAGPWVVGHRDLHPDNVVVAPDGSLRALDWEDAGPVDPSRELAKVLAQWHIDGDRIDEQAVRATVAAYREGGGTGTVRGQEDLALWLCGETNYLARQARLALDPATSADRRHHAETDIGLLLTSYLPPLDVLDSLVEVARG
jgi:aminoglycoside phosphotransferase (APT) family kinase protein